MAQTKSGSWLSEILLKHLVAVGRTPEEHLEWLLDLVADKESPEDKAETVGKVTAFALAEGWRSTRPKLPLLDLEATLANLRGSLNKIEDGLQFRMKGRDITWNAHRDADGHIREYHQGELADVFLWLAHKLLAQNLNLIGRCGREQCSKLFVIKRKGQRYCSPAHSQADRNERFASKEKVNAKASE